MIDQFKYLRPCKHDKDCPGFGPGHKLHKAIDEEFEKAKKMEEKADDGPTSQSSRTSPDGS